MIGRKLSRSAAVLLVGFATILSLHCSRGATPPSSRGEEDATSHVAPSSDDGGPRDGDDGGGDAAPATSVERGITGVVRVLEGAPSGSVIAALPGSTKLVATAPLAADGRFHLPALAPETYRLIVPADGVHSTADLYVEVGPDAGLTEVEIPRSRGCAVTIKVRAHDNHLISGAVVDLRLTDLPHVVEPHQVQRETDENGQIVVQGSCVRGFFEGSVTLADGRQLPFRHGYVGTGRDQFDIVLPSPESPDAGVTFTNND